MKIWYDVYPSLKEDPKMALDWYTHRPRKKEWRGYTIQVTLFSYSIDFNWVDDYVSYKAAMNSRMTRTTNH